MAELVVVTELEGAGGGLACAAALGCALAGLDRDGAGVVLAEARAQSVRRRGPTMLASEPARRHELALREAGFDVAARGRLAWVALDPGEEWVAGVTALAGAAVGARFLVVHGAAERVRSTLAAARGPLTVVIRAELPRQRPLASLLARELRYEGVAVRLATRAPGRIGARRALAGIDPGGEASRRACRLARGIGTRAMSPRGQRVRLIAEAGQALPLVLGSLLALIACTLVLAAFGGAVTGASRAQRAADLSALSAARSMRDDFDRLFVAARRADGTENPDHLDKSEYLARAGAAAREAAARNGVAVARLRVEFPDGDSLAPLRVRTEVEAELDGPGDADSVVAAHAEAEAVLPAAAAVTPSGPAVASGGGYAGPLAYRQGEGMRPDVAAAFDRMAAAAAQAGVGLLINSAYRSDAEQAVLFAEHPDPRWVAPPGTSLHRCATELDLGPPTAQAWLAANAGRFGFVQRYSWEPWHFGYTAGPAPCSAEADHGSAEPPTRAADGASAELSLPAFVPAGFRSPIAAAAQRWNVSAALLAAQLMAESNFNPFALSPAGAAGIAQFMPGTAALYGLGDPFDAEASIEAQAHLMSDLLGQFGSPSLALAAYNAGPAPVAACGCVPAIPETQAYVARILGLMGGAGVAPPAPTLEVRLVD
jgi:Transglycosylase SLT domain/D-alanyl-D-alanine carboxypeptidase